MKKMVLFLFFCFPCVVFSQEMQFTTDSIPTVNNKVVFDINFKYNLSKESFHTKVIEFLNNGLEPYSGLFLKSTDDYTVCRITDYLNISEKFFQTYGVYMTYTVQVEYKDGECNFRIFNISYVEKQYFEAQEQYARKLNIPSYTAEDMMINKGYVSLTLKDASKRITEESIKRINFVLKQLHVVFME